MFFAAFGISLILFGAVDSAQKKQQQPSLLSMATSQDVMAASREKDLKCLEIFKYFCQKETLQTKRI